MSAPRERPLICSDHSVRQILADKKTQTRRVVRPQPPKGWDRHCWFDAPIYGWTYQDQPAGIWHKARCLFGHIGDRLWVREAFLESDSYDYENDCWRVFYRATDSGEIEPDRDEGARWQTPLFMPRRLSRITLELTDIRVQRVTDITEEDALAEGYDSIGAFMQAFVDLNRHRKLFDWDTPPWVWAITFRRIA